MGEGGGGGEGGFYGLFCVLLANPQSYMHSGQNIDKIFVFNICVQYLCSIFVFNI